MQNLPSMPEENSAAYNVLPRVLAGVALASMAAVTTYLLISRGLQRRKHHAATAGEEPARSRRTATTRRTEKSRSRAANASKTSATAKARKAGGRRTAKSSKSRRRSSEE